MMIILNVWIISLYDLILFWLMTKNYSILSIVLPIHYSGCHVAKNMPHQRGYIYSHSKILNRSLWLSMFQLPTKFQASFSNLNQNAQSHKIIHRFQSFQALLSIWIPIGVLLSLSLPVWISLSSPISIVADHRSLCPINQWCLPLPIFNY
jgi:hypothetical protein